MSDIYWKRYSVIFSTMEWNENAHPLSHGRRRPESQKRYDGDPDVPIKFVCGERISWAIRG
jgi:hypothetical protein